MDSINIQQYLRNLFTLKPIETMEAKAIVIEGKLVRIEACGNFYRLNGLGKWTQIKPMELYNLITQTDEKEID